MFMDRRSKGPIDFFEKNVAHGVGEVQLQPALFDLLGQSPKSPRCRLSHQSATYRAAEKLRGRTGKAGPLNRSGVKLE